MCGWDPMNHSEWAQSADALTVSGIEWPAGLAAHDLRWWAARARLSGERFPTERALAARWGWTKYAASKLRKDVEAWADPKHMDFSRALVDRLSGRAPAWMQDSGQATSSDEPDTNQQSGSVVASPQDSREDSGQDTVSNEADVGQDAGTTRAFPLTDTPSTEHRSLSAGADSGPTLAERYQAAWDALNAVHQQASPKARPLAFDRYAKDFKACAKVAGSASKPNPERVVLAWRLLWTHPGETWHRRTLTGAKLVGAFLRSTNGFTQWIRLLDEWEGEGRTVPEVTGPAATAPGQPTADLFAALDQWGEDDGD